jgi:hypothetical protein
MGVGGEKMKPLMVVGFGLVSLMILLSHLFLSR